MAGGLRDHCWKKGQSGNPGGRAKKPYKVAEQEAKQGVRDLCRSFTRDAVNALAEVVNNRKTPAAARVGAAIALLDRGWGKPVQVVAGEDGGPVRIERIECVLVDVALKSAEEPRLVQIHGGQ